MEGKGVSPAYTLVVISSFYCYLYYPISVAPSLPYASRRLRPCLRLVVLCHEASISGSTRRRLFTRSLHILFPRTLSIHKPSSCDSELFILILGITGTLSYSVIYVFLFSESQLVPNSLLRPQTSVSVGNGGFQQSQFGQFIDELA